ncbi:unnamed protein product [Trichogramma brassicae]|uniref:Uncharacterized protein n=1 Tax=Trichogramma brassicae TaxID=86971 RepID=A0A6H5I027_9HYME|nr:unnamed protein product [Trichogramma brassicae]
MSTPCSATWAYTLLPSPPPPGSEDVRPKISESSTEKQQEWLRAPRENMLNIGGAPEVNRRVLYADVVDSILLDCKLPLSCTQQIERACLALISGLPHVSYDRRTYVIAASLCWAPLAMSERAYTSAAPSMSSSDYVLLPAPHNSSNRGALRPGRASPHEGSGSSHRGRSSGGQSSSRAARSSASVDSGVSRRA